MTSAVPQRDMSLLLGADVVLRTPAEFAKFIMQLSDTQVGHQANYRPIDLDEFQLGCDTLNLARLALRLDKDFGADDWVQVVLQATIDSICAVRGYDINEFMLALEATQHRARFPLGIRPLEEAVQLAKVRPLVLKNPRLAGATLLAVIATIALELQQRQKDGTIILPVEHLRRLLRQRKLLVGGALKILVKHKLLAEVDPTYFPGKAREFRFIGREGIDFERPEAEP